MLKFKTIRYKNFISAPNQFIEIDLAKKKERLTLFQGLSGSGKSSMLDALGFVLFNKPFRKIKKDDVVNSINKKDCLVEIEFSSKGHEYAIQRGIKPNIFEIKKDGIVLPPPGHAKDYQQILENDILGVNYKTFKQIIVLGATNFVPFMRLSPSERRVIVEEVLGIQIFATMQQRLKERVSVVREQVRSLINEQEMTGERLEWTKKSYGEWKAGKDGIIGNLEKEIDDTKQKIDRLTDECDDLTSKIKKILTELQEYKGLTKKIKEIEKLKHELEIREKLNKNNMKFLKETDVCPTCAQHIDDNFRTNEVDKYEKIIEKSRNKLEVLHEILVKFLTKEQTFNKLNQEHNQLINNLEQKKNTISLLRSTVLSRAEKELIKIKDPATEKSKLNEIAEIEKKFIGIKKQLDVCSKTDELYKAASIILQDGGIKAAVVKKFLPLINGTVNKFLNGMNFLVRINIDEEFNEVIKSRGYDEFGYENFSEGEKQRIDLALLFTWRVVAKAKNSVNTNLLIMDEVFDSYLDQTATEAVIDMLKSDMFENTNALIISHKNTLNDFFDRVIHFEKRNNFTNIRIDQP